jgi:hypothetical protein
MYISKIANIFKTFHQKNNLKNLDNNERIFLYMGSFVGANLGNQKAIFDDVYDIKDDFDKCIKIGYYLSVGSLLGFAWPVTVPGFICYKMFQKTLLCK